ncbi:MAG: hypothetical protein IIA14_03305 [SAR324 cluster bacterium]|nr:hypothetical protein [SAR324 cluster bacterium]
MSLRQPIPVDHVEATEAEDSTVSDAAWVPMSVSGATTSDNFVATTAWVQQSVEESSEISPIDESFDVPSPWYSEPGVEDMVIADWSDAPERLATNTELGAKLNEGISMLPDELKAAVVLRDVEGLSNTEAAEVLDITVSSLKSRLHRGRVMLRKHLEDFLKVKG